MHNVILLLYIFMEIFYIHFSPVSGVLCGTKASLWNLTNRVLLLINSSHKDAPKVHCIRARYLKLSLDLQEMMLYSNLLTDIYCF